MKRRSLVIALILGLLVLAPQAARARAVHYFNCADCHRSGSSIVSLSNGLCWSCHGRDKLPVELNDGKSRSPTGRFDDIDASNALGSHTNYNAAAATQTSHMWAGADSKREAGAQGPTFYKSQFDGRYGISRGKLICNRCHNPHGVSGYDKKILKLDNSRDQMCRDCHLLWATSDPDALESHPMVEDYPAFATANSDKYKTGYNAVTGILDNNVAQGEVRLVYNSATGKYMVSCTSCHGVHFTDSRSGTSDGVDNVDYNSVGDGNLLRSDGVRGASEGSSAFTYNAAVLRSNLCQACHTYKIHGKTDGAGDLFLGCLDCHGGHSYNDGDVFFYALKKGAFNPIPSYNAAVSFGGYAGTGGDAGLYFNYNSLVSIDPAEKWKIWNDQFDGTAKGYCETCHGDAKYIPGSPNHNSGGVCTDCHYHDYTDWTYSFQNNSNAESCGDCHGYPPYRNVAGDRVQWPANDGGYGWMSATHNYNTVGKAGGFFKDETLTPHNTHAAGKTSQGADTDYRFASNQGACDKCHNNLSANHQETTDDTSFQDVNFDAYSSNGGLTPTYNKNTGVCSDTYCHSNGGRRVDDSTNVYNSVDTPSWDQGKGKIIGQTSPKHECQFCHGNDASSMNGVNSSSHLKHVAKYSCNVCHSSTAASSTVVYNTARWIQNGGTHVNGLPTVQFNTTYNLGYAILNSVSFNGADGTCTAYCHSNGKGDTVTAPDWDLPATGACGACHGIDSTTLTSGSHVQHIDPAGANIACDQCHDDGAAPDGSYDTNGENHADGSLSKRSTATSCDVCHGVESPQEGPWDVGPTWGQGSSVDCRTCHTGTTQTSYTDISAAVHTAPDKNIALGKGHNYNSVTNYAETDNPAANKSCSGVTGCHTAINADHVGGASTKLLPGTFACEDCHTAAGSRNGEASVDVRTHDNRDPSYAAKKKQPDFTKVCLACHDPHGSSNIAMVGTSKGDFSGVVVFERFNSVTLGDGFDELDGGGANNLDDICATCHTTTGHNTPNITEATQDHNEGKWCLQCHTHDSTLGGFMPSGGDFCNDCHGNPPSPSDPRPADSVGAHKAHTNVANNDPTEDKYDCGVCHQGGEAFGIDGAHSTAPLVVAIGYNATSGTCSGACHLSDTSDGFWDDPNGLNCDACHYHTDAIQPNGVHTKSISGSHTRHFDKGKACTACHADNSADAGSHPEHRAHIDDHEPWALNNTNDGTVLQDRGAATQDEAKVNYNAATTQYSFNDGTNSCSNTSNNGLGCHATGSPVWMTAGPLACTACHTNKSTSAVNPTSGLHSVVPKVSGIQHDESFPYNGGGSTGDCTTCHTTSPSSGHQDGVMDATRGATGNVKITFAANVGYSDGVEPTCAPGYVGCHFEQPTKTVDWKRRWHEGAADQVGACAGCHGDWVNGWNTDVQHHTNAKAQSTHGSGTNWQCMDCHGLEASTNAYTFTFDTNDWNPKAGETSLHGNGEINVNYNVTGWLRVGGQSGCPGCHTYWDTDGKHAYVQTEWSATTINGDEPKVTCSTCHGGLTVGPSASNFWPDKANDFGGGGDLSEDNQGRHRIHIKKLAVQVYGEDYNTALLTDNGNGTAEVKQKELCAYCHSNPGADADHSNTMPAETGSFFALWEKPRISADADIIYNATTDNCANVDCHNGKDTASTATFDWYGNGTKNCALCHNDITVTSAGTTGASHDAHINGSATYGRSVVCSDCHGGSPDWASYTVPSSGHIDNNFVVSGGNVSFTYNATTFNCGVNLCHNNGKNAAAKTAGYAWRTAIAGCAACHETSSTLGESHPAHLDAKPNYGLTISCPDCHEAVSASDMTGKTSHMNGEVTLAGGITYTGLPSSVDVTVAATWGQCTNSSCHKKDTTTAVNSPVWGNVAATTCAICHNDGGSNPYPATGRHGDHVPNATYVTSSCGNCHAGAGSTQYNSLNHLDASVETGADITVHVGGSSTCTNNCHVVDATGNWGDTATLDCTECHTTGTIADAKGALPSSGLHAVTPTISATTHDGILLSGNCVNCHLGSGPTDSHLNGILNNSGNAIFNFNSVTVSGYNSAGCRATCHADNGDWKRQWSATAANSDGSECVNCHGGIGAGYTATTWVGGIIPDHTYNWDGDASVDNPEVMTKHSVCKTCHGFNGAADKDVNYNVATMHRNAQITLNGGTNYNAANWGCDNAVCHGGAAASHALAGSGWTVELGAFAAGGSCFGCHGNGVDQYWPDGSSSHEANDNPGAHAVHVTAIADEMDGDGTKGPVTGTLNEKNATCDYCHPGNTHGGADGVVPADVSQTDTDGSYPPAEVETGTYFKYIIGGVVDGNASYNLGSNTCSTVKCHAGAPYSPRWYPDLTPPAAIGELASYNSAVGYNSVEPGQVLLTWLAPGNDGDLDQVAYRYDVRMRESGSGAIDAANFDASPKVGGVPTVQRYNKAEAMVVDGLDTALSYTFAVKTADADGNWSNISNVPPAIKPHADDVTPDFSGVGTAKAADAGAAANLHWEQAIDHSPVTYDIFYADVSTGIDYGSPQVSDFAGISYQVTGLDNNKVFEFAVRAKDDHGNAETNTIVASVMPEAPPTIDYDPTVTYYFDGANSIGAARSITGSPVTIASGANNVWTRGTTYGVDTDVSGGSLVVYVKDAQGGGSTDANLMVELGYGNFSTFSTPVTVNLPIGKKSARVVTIKFNGAGGMVPQGQALAVRLSSTGSGPLAISYGDANTQGDLFVKERIYNHPPSPVVFSVQPIGGGEVLIDWGTPSTDQDGHAVHYDVYGSIDDGVTYPYIIGTNLPGATTSAVWDTQTDRIHTGVSPTVKVKVEAGDPYSHSPTESSAWAVDNTLDTISPAAPINLLAQMRPKQGSVYLSWTAPGDDNGSHGAAASYDIRYSQSDITNDTEWDAATPVTDPPTLSVPPVPQFAKTRQHLEVLGLDPGTLYYFAIRAVDENNNVSPIGTSAANSAKGGPKCGHCHSTPPDSDANAGNHSKHGYTLEECAVCHGDMTGITGAHQDGNLDFGFGAGGAHTGFVSGSDIVYTNNGLAMGSGGDFIIYHDDGAESGSGGFNPTGGDGTDNGTCGNFTATGVDAFGCHSSATPKWDHSEKLACGDCHGDVDRTDDWYSRPYDATKANSNVVPDEIKASPPIDNHGNDGASGGVDQKKYVGAHEKHLNYSFRFSKGNSCNLCHKGSEHANGDVDINLDPDVVGTSANYNSSSPGVAATCGSLDPNACHDAGPAPEWQAGVTFACNNCHGFGGADPDHVSDGGVRACTYCHPAGHPSGTPSGTFLIPNNPTVGINYGSGGIHIYNSISGGPYGTEAEICWGCHDRNGVSEWRGDDVVSPGTANTTAAGPDYNFGNLDQSNWVGATWSSSEAIFAYKQGLIQSTHTTGLGSSAVTGSDYNYTEAPDAVGLIRCTNCHDVHNRNLALGDDATGNPYLRGSWKNNPYLEDGAPRSTSTYAELAPTDTTVAKLGFGQVPRGGAGHAELGGFQIDQNNGGSPTGGWTLDDVGGLCTLCHGRDVNTMDQLADVQNLWLGNNGHANAAIGGDGTGRADILNFSIRHGANLPSDFTGSGMYAGNPTMGYANALAQRVYGWRGAYANYGWEWPTLPQVGGTSASGAGYCGASFNWGVIQDNGTAEKGYHSFSCSKCHNPHASRLPKLMITNCLDTQHNKWDDSMTLPGASDQNPDASGVYPSAENAGKTLSQATSAQNCHRYGDPTQSATGPGWNTGWNKVTPWPKANEPAAP